MAKITLLLIISVVLRFMQHSRSKACINKARLSKNILPVALKQLSSIDPSNKRENTVMEMVAQNYIEHGIVCVKFLNLGLLHNTHDNEYGKALLNLTQTAGKFLEWLKENLRTNKHHLQSTLEASVNKFGPFIPATKKAFENIKESSKDIELAVNNFMNSLDNVLSLFTRMQVYLENKMASNGELLSKTKQILSETFGSLDKVSSDSYSINELVVYSRQLKMFIHQLIDRIKTLLKPQAKLSETITAINGAVKNLNQIENEIQNKVTQKTTLPLLQKFFKTWLMSVLETIGNLENSMKDKIDEIRTVLYDTLGIAAVYKTEFDILVG